MCPLRDSVSWWRCGRIRVVRGVRGVRGVKGAGEAEGCGNSEGGHGAEISGGYWGLLGAELKLLTGVRE